MSQDNDSIEYRSGEQLLSQWKLVGREARLEKAVKVLMAEIDRLHVEHEEQSLAENLFNKSVFCSCADAYRMGAAALDLVKP